MSWFSQKRSLLHDLFTAFTLIGCIQAGIGTLLVYCFRNRYTNSHKNTSSPFYPPVTILKPLANKEPLLKEALQSFCEQDYSKIQIIFGVQSQDDQSIPIVHELKQQYPELDIKLVIDTHIHGTNRKVSNLINMLPYAKYEHLLISDSDIHIKDNTYLKKTITLLDNPKVGLVTSLYSGLPSTPSFLQKLASANINYNFMPGVLLARILGRQDCLGASIAITKTVLKKIGGLEILLPYVADDALLGQLIKTQSMEIRLAPDIVKTTICENSFKELYKHELRWNRTVFSVEPIGFILSFLQFPLLWASLSLLLKPFQRKSWIFFIGSLFFKSVFSFLINKKIKLDLKNIPLILLCRDWLSAFIMIKSIIGKDVEWRGQKMTIQKTSVSNLKRQ